MPTPWHNLSAFRLNSIDLPIYKLCNENRCGSQPWRHSKTTLVLCRATLTERLIISSTLNLMSPAAFVLARTSCVPTSRTVGSASVLVKLGPVSVPKIAVTIVAILLSIKIVATIL